MYLLKNITKSITSKKIVCLLIVIQFSLCLQFLLGGIIKIREIRYSQELFNSTLKCNPERVVRFSALNGSTSEYYISRLNEMYEYIGKKVGKDSFGSYITSKEYYILGDNNIADVRVIKTDSVFFNIININLISGKRFMPQDFSRTDRIPVIAGYNLRNSFKLGKEIIDRETGVKYYISGIAAKNSFWIGDYGTPVTDVVNIDNSFIMPILKQEMKEKDTLLGCINNQYCIIPEGSNYGNIRRDIFKKSRELKINFTSRLLKELVNEVDTQQRNSASCYAFLGIFGGGFSALGLLTVFLAQINSKKREIGIRLTAGASFNNIINLVLFEILLILSVAGTIALYLLYTTKQSEIEWSLRHKNTVNAGSYVDNEIILVAFGIVVAMSIIVTILPAFRICKLQIREMIGGRD